MAATASVIRPDPDLASATASLAAGDPVLGALVERHGPPELRGRRTGRSRFEQLAEAICYQQLAGRAAEAIWRRARSLVDGPFDAASVVAVGPERLRGAGLSNAKTASIIDLATKVLDGTVRLDRIGRLDDEAVIEHLVVVRGIGRWTAEMFLIFTLRRLDVWPVGDLGVRVGYARAYGLSEPPTPKALEELGDRFRPYRTIAAWYCWRVAGTEQPE
jgi:3-methyladenine DNA glycosylase/8-oxoguanine DNA glycosylase